MEQVVSENKKLSSPPPHRLTSVIIVLVLISGLASAMFAGITVDLRSRDYLVGRAQTIADSLPANSVSFLEGKPSDTAKFEYTQVKRILERVKANNSDLKYVYIMENRQPDPVFLVDATAEGTNDFSAPGQPYLEGTEQLRRGFSSNQPFIEGPGRDQWGNWLSAFAPITDRSTNQTIAWVGIDTPAVAYYIEVLVYAMVPLILAAIPLVGLVRDRKLAAKEWEIADLKQQFVSIASHELRSPLSGMIWAIQSLQKSGDKNMTGEQKALLNDMFQSVQVSTATINEILDLTVFERNRSDKPKDDIVELHSVVAEVEKTLRLGAQEKRLTLVTELFPDTAYTRGDVMALKRAFMNVLSNAVKYSFEGSTIYLRYRQDKGEHIISVKDHGIGVPKHEQKKILGGYYRARNAKRAQARGTGLGLWMTRLIIESHGGRIWLYSEENVGTTIYIAMPIHQPGESTAATAASPVRQFGRVKDWFSISKWLHRRP